MAGQVGAGWLTNCNWAGGEESNICSPFFGLYSFSFFYYVVFLKGSSHTGPSNDAAMAYTFTPELGVLCSKEQPEEPSQGREGAGGQNG